MDCPHGDPFPGSTSEMHEVALDTILELIQKYDEQGRKDVGYKAARKFATKLPDIVDTFLVAFLVSTGTRAILYNDENKDSQNKPFVFHVAQVISAFEKRLYGSASAADVENENIITFYKMRTPCSCLDDIVHDPDEEECGTCAAEGCGACKPLSELSACAGCRAVVYCDANCQRIHWPKHAPVCSILKERLSESDTTSITDLETSGQFSVYSGASARSGKSGRSAKSHSSDKSGKSRHRPQKLDRAPRSPLKSPTRSPRKLPTSPTKSVKSVSSPRSSSRRKLLTKEDSKKKRKVRKSLSSSDDPVEEKKHHSKTKKKSDKLNSSSGELSVEKKERRSDKLNSSSGEFSVEKKERRKSKSSSSRHHDDGHKERSKSKTRSSSKARSASREKRHSKTKKKKHDEDKVREELVQ